MYHGIVNQRMVPVRKSFGSKSERVDELLYGMPVWIKEETNMEWIKVESFYHYTGYIRRRELIYNLDENSWEKRMKKVVIKNFADVLEKPKISSPVLMTLLKGAVVRWEGGEEGWSKIVTWEGEKGYMRSEYLSKSPFFGDLYFQKNAAGILRSDKEETFRNNLVKTAYSYLGVPYRWGGKTAMGIDCSGLCSMVYLLNGVVIYRDAKRKEGFPIKKIPPKQMKRGDLLYFKGHIAMYTGDGRYIHSTAKMGSGGVVLNSLKKESREYREDLAKGILEVGSLFPAGYEEESRSL
jgi:hypothetical protein